MSPGKFTQGALALVPLPPAWFLAAAFLLPIGAEATRWGGVGAGADGCHTGAPGWDIHDRVDAWAIRTSPSLTAECRSKISACINKSPGPHSEGLIPEKLSNIYFKAEK